MTEWEFECWTWYRESVTPATIKAGLVPMLWPALEGAAAEVFLRAFNKMGETYERVDAERREDGMRKKGTK